MNPRTVSLAAILTAAVFLSVSCSEDAGEAPADVAAKPAAPREIERYPLRRAFFGDLHVHTSLSTDAYSFGNRVGPRAAYRFARGETVELPNGIDARLATPLDFVALTDHAEGFDAIHACSAGGPLVGSELCAVVGGAVDADERFRTGFARGVLRPAARLPGVCPDGEATCLQHARSTWERVQRAANEADDPGAFTALIGYEFTPLLPQFGMLHRNVIFRGEEVIPHAVSSMDVRNQSEFFARLDAGCTPPCRVLTIPHNTNFSWGLAFSRDDEDGTRYTQADLERIVRMDRLAEVTQLKGTSECQVGVGAADEDCDFGILFPVCAEGETERCASETSFIRDALLDGIQLAAEGRPNQFRYGMIGSTDTHDSNPGNTTGVVPPTFVPALGNAPAVRQALEAEHIVIGAFRRVNVGGLAGVWAEANTRADIFDALTRREAFGTSGSRMRIRFFAGDLPEEMDTGEEQLAAAYAGGVPMGGELVGIAEPSFWVWAMSDPDGPLLDRIQVVKGWAADPAVGEAMQRVRDVACSGGREPGEDGKCVPTAATVDIETCERKDATGAAELQARFVDPDYAPDRHAFYYVRVLENPTCRWPTRLALSANVDLPGDVPATEQQRGWSSPIWFRPD
ncbi:MAG: DUF3604 domain-containing protein [Gammaproteobacteria bacterium]|nr:DUF3604 domain-containing protein [Gammaproteobacteria bacterium]